MNEPKLRFKADGEIPFPDWEKKELSDICELITVGIANSATQAYRDTGVIMFRNQNIKENYLDTSDLIYIDPEFEKRYKKKRLKADDLLIVRTGYPGTACLVPPEYEDAQTFTTLIARLIKNENVPAYVCQYINSPLGKSYFESTQIGGGQKNSGAKILENFPISLPSLPEQQKIAFLFTELDTIIHSAEKELEGYGELKQGMLQKMFPKKGETVPEIRFPEFTGDWEQHKLGDLAKIVGGGTPSTANADFWDGEINWFAPAEITNQVYVSSSERKITELGYNSSSARMLPIGTVLFTSRAGIGKTAILCEKACTNQGFQSIVPDKSKLDSYFIFSRSAELKRYGETIGAGSTFVEVSGKQMAAMSLMMPPTLDEQRKIGTYFQNLDNLITLQQKEIDGYKELKKGLLQQMFC